MNHCILELAGYFLHVRSVGKGYSLPIAIEQGTCLCLSSILLGGVIVGRCGVVAAGASVKRDVNPGSVFVSVPAREIKKFGHKAAK